jgi:hypothetical protein
MANFTPGPWHGQRGHQTPYIRGIFADGGNIVNFQGIARPTSAEGQANALLMIASPDLLEAAECQEDLERYCSGNSGTRIGIVAKWLHRIEELSPRENGSKHEAHASWTQFDFCGIPEKMRRAAIAKAKGEV